MFESIFEMSGMTLNFDTRCSGLLEIITVKRKKFQTSSSGITIATMKFEPAVFKMMEQNTIGSMEAWSCGYRMR